MTCAWRDGSTADDDEIADPSCCLGICIRIPHSPVQSQSQSQSLADRRARHTHTDSALPRTRLTAPPQTHGEQGLGVQTREKNGQGGIKGALLGWDVGISSDLNEQGRGPGMMAA